MLRRDPGIEFARVIGCLIVIGCHIGLFYRTEPMWDYSRTLIAMFFSDGVGIFWMISGAFLFNNKGYGKLIIKTIKSILFPTLFVGAIYFYFGKWISGQVSFLESLKHPLEDYKIIFVKFLSWSNGVDSFGHSWYIYVYCMVIVIYPAIQAVVEAMKQNKKRQCLFLACTMALTIVNDITKNQLMQYSHHSINGAIPAAIIIIWGYILYENKKYLCHKITPILAITVLVLTNVIRFYIQISRVNADGGNDINIMYWYSSLGMIAAMCVVIIAMSIFPNREMSFTKNVVCCIASYTFPVYLIHILIRGFYNGIGMSQYLQQLILGWKDNIFGELLYTVLFVMTIFITSMLIVMISRYIFKFLKKVILLTTN